MLSLIVAHTENYVIGRGGKMPWHLPRDLRHFKELTWGHTIIMGRKTYESIGGPLPGRLNVVVTGNPDYQAAEGVALVPSLAEGVRRGGSDKEIFVIGGSQLYKTAFPLADRLYVTLIKAHIEGDAFFPRYSPEDFDVLSREEFSGDMKNAFAMEFLTLARKSHFL